MGRTGAAAAGLPSGTNTGGDAPVVASTVRPRGRARHDNGTADSERDTVAQSARPKRRQKYVTPYIAGPLPMRVEVALTQSFLPLLRRAIEQERVQRPRG